MSRYTVIAVMKIEVQMLVVDKIVMVRTDGHLGCAFNHDPVKGNQSSAERCGCGKVDWELYL